MSLVAYSQLLSFRTNCNWRTEMPIEVFYQDKKSYNVRGTFVPVSYAIVLAAPLRCRPSRVHFVPCSGRCVCDQPPSGPLRSRLAAFLRPSDAPDGGRREVGARPPHGGNICRHADGGAGD